MINLNLNIIASLLLKTSLLACLLGLSFPLVANANHAFNEKKGYIITFDKKEIAGKITNLYYSDLGCRVTFKNTGGDEYLLQPYLIKGFVLIESNGEAVYYISKYYRYKWYFLRLLKTGPIADLYQSPDHKAYFGSFWDYEKLNYNLDSKDDPNNSLIESHSNRKIKEFWIEFRKHQELIALYPTNYKKVLRRKLSRYPLISKKIGKNGYKLRHIEKIVDELNATDKASKIL